MTTPPPPPPSSQPNPETPDLTNAYSSFKHNAALALLIGAPILIAIPPRKLDLYTFSLTGAFIASANQLTKERTGGKGLLAQFGYKSPYAYSGSEGEGKRLLEEDVKVGGVQGQSLGTRVAGGKGGGVDWKEKRLKEEQEKLDNGEGYGDMIVDQIWDVWNQKGKKKGKDGE